MQYAGGLIEHECPRCHRAVELPFGALCRSCVAELDRRAAWWGNRVAMAATLLLAAWIYFLRRPVDPTARMVSAMGIVICFTLTNLIVRRAVREMTR
jgi:hypothetical protein